MAELFRFRSVRGIRPGTGNVLDLSELIGDPGSGDSAGSPSHADAPDAETGADRGGRTGTRVRDALVSDLTDIGLAGLSARLSAQDDLADPGTLIGWLPSDWMQTVVSPAWRRQGRLLVGALSVALSAAPSSRIVQGQQAEALCRLILVHDLITTLAADQPRPAGQRILGTARDVQRAVLWRLISLPQEYFPQHLKSTLVRAPGVTDLYVVRDEWNRYEPAQIARVLNVLPGESFETRIKHFQEQDDFRSTATSSSTTEQSEHDTTTTTSLSQASSKDAALNIGVQGQVETSGQYGLTKVGTHFGAQVQTSQSQADTSASATARQTVERAVKSVSQTVVDIRSSRTITRDSTAEDHKLGNQGSGTTVGVYRWLNEIHRVRLEKYPNRYTLEFEVPEPGAWLRWALQDAPAGTRDNPDPGPFCLPGTSTPVTPALMRDHWQELAAAWRVGGLQPPPPATITLSVPLVEQDKPDQYLYQTVDSSLAVPSGYQATGWTASVVAKRQQPTTSSTDGTQIIMSVGGSTPQSTPSAPAGQQVWLIDQTLSGSVGGINTGSIPVSVWGYMVAGYNVVANVTCTLMDDAATQWQESTFDQIASAYQNLLDAYHRERDARQQQIGSQVDLAGPPQLNAERCVNELKKLVIGDLMGRELTGDPDDVTTGATGVDGLPAGEPSVQIKAAASHAAAIQFFEQAFEWENLVYICYPYYWSRHSQWITNATSVSSDPALDRFLNAGSARVVLPARPGFELLVAFYLYTGLIWGGSRPPAPNDPDYLSVAQEIEAVQRGAVDGTQVGSSWEVTVPTTLLWAGDDPGTLPVNPDPVIPPPDDAAGAAGAGTANGAVA